MALPDDKVQLKSMVQYNHALALARAGKLEEAVQKVDLVLANPSDKVKVKAQALKTRLSAAIDMGTPFQLNAAAETGKPAVKDVSSGAVTTAEVQIVEILPNPGDIGCYMIYEAPANSEKITGMLAKPLSFAARAGIQREETMKAKGKAVYSN